MSIYTQCKKQQSLCAAAQHKLLTGMLTSRTTSGVLIFSSHHKNCIGYSARCSYFYACLEVARIGHRPKHCKK